MEKTAYIERLMEFGLTRQEASIYQCLLGEGKMTGYEVAKQTGISRSNAYNSLASMTEKGASYLVEEGTTRKYVRYRSRNSVKTGSAGWKRQDSGWRSTRRLKNPMWKDILPLKGKEYPGQDPQYPGKVDQRVYISCTRNYLLLLVRELEELRKAKKKVVIITDQPVNYEGRGCM